MKRWALIFSIFAIFLVAGGLVVSETVKQNTDEITIIQNSKTQKPQIIPNSKFQNPKISENPLPAEASAKAGRDEIRVNPSMEEQVLGEETGRLSVNEATLEELDTIPGVGPVTAQKIIDVRPWEDLEEALKLISSRYRASAREKLKL